MYSSRPEGEALSILLIDDDEGDRFTIDRALRRSGLSYQLLEADDRAPAVEAHGELPVDLVLLDYNLPGGESLSSMEEIRRAWPRAAIVLTTGEGTDDVVAAAFRNGVADYIGKADISARSIRRVTENAVAAQRMQLQLDNQRAELKSFAHILAHDVKGPVRSIKMLSEWISESIDTGQPENARADLAQMVKTVSRLDALVTTLEEHLRLGKEPAREVMRIAELAQDAVDNLQADIRARNARVEIGMLPQAFCDGPQITQLFQNLIANGLKFSEADMPTVRIATHTGEEGLHVISVSDNGIGISPEYSEKIFEPFKRMHTGYEGTGLGLATCRKIVTRHGGRIWCEPGRDEGTSFFFSLPDAALDNGPSRQHFVDNNGAVGGGELFRGPPQAI
ncbi:MAG: response regulator [Rhodobacteraceae bacterium]|nr:response regulator [Paracoccaceae bacterium]MBR9819671.1 response regulator [Paracoccaceae bacterium]